MFFFVADGVEEQSKIYITNVIEQSNGRRTDNNEQFDFLHQKFQQRREGTRDYKGAVEKFHSTGRKNGHQREPKG